MAEFQFTPRAEADLRTVWRTIAADNEKAADDLILRIFGKIERAAALPGIGAARPELSPTARILVEGRYVVIYEPTTEGILVVAIVHGVRDPQNWLG